MTRRLRRHGAVLAVAGGLLLTGCTSGQLGAAAVVGGRGVPVRELQTSMRELKAIDPAIDTRAAQRSVLTSLISSRVLAQVAAERHVSVTDGEVDAFLRQSAAQSGGADALRRTVATQQNGFISPSQLPARARDILLRVALARVLVPGADSSQQVTSQRTAALNSVLVEKSKALGVAVNPRYGAWDARTGVEAVRSGGLAKPESGAPTPDQSTG